MHAVECNCETVQSVLNNKNKENKKGFFCCQWKQFLKVYFKMQKYIYKRRMEFWIVRYDIA